MNYRMPIERFAARLEEDFRALADKYPGDNLRRLLESTTVAVFEYLGLEEGLSLQEKVLRVEGRPTISVDFAKDLLTMLLERERVVEACRWLDTLPEDLSQPLRTSFSIVVVTKDRGNSISETLSCLRNLVYPSSQMEIIVVDNGSADNTKVVVEEELAGAPCDVRIIYQPDGRICAARNAGIGVAKGDWIGFIDDDARCKSDWLLNYLLGSLSFPEAAAMGGPSRLPDHYLRPKWWNERCNLLSSCQEKHEKTTKTGFLQYPFGLNMWFRREVFAEVGLFDSRLDASCRSMHDETELFYRIQRAGYDIVYVPSAVVTHCISEDRMRYGNLIRRAFLVGQADRVVEIIHPNQLRLGFSSFAGFFKALAAPIHETPHVTIPLLISRWAGYVCQLFFLRRSLIREEDRSR